MGQQQLLLLVLSTVIVGLATIAGIQAFQESEAQATQDALVQRAMSLGNKVLAAHNEPDQMGGITLGTSSDSKVADALGVSSLTNISADGAGDAAGCTITNSDPATVECGSQGPTSGDQTVTVTVTPEGSPAVEVTSLTTTS